MIACLFCRIHVDSGFGYDTHILQYLYDLYLYIWGVPINLILLMLLQPCLWLFIMSWVNTCPLHSIYYCLKNDAPHSIRYYTGKVVETEWEVTQGLLRQSILLLVSWVWKVSFAVCPVAIFFAGVISLFNMWATSCYSQKTWDLCSLAAAQLNRKPVEHIQASVNTVNEDLAEPG